MLNDLKENQDRNEERIMEIQKAPATHTLEEYQKLKSLNAMGRLKMIQALVIPGPAYMRWRYRLKHSWILPIWYIYRWWGIFVDGIKTYFHLIEKISTRLDQSAKDGK